MKQNILVFFILYIDICAKIDMGALGMQCREISPALYYSYSSDALKYQESQGITFENVICSSNLVPNYFMFGGMKSVENDKCETDDGIKSAEIILITFSSISTSDSEQRVWDWQDDLRDYIDDVVSKDLKYTKVNYYWGNGVNNEVVRGITDAIPKIAISIALVIVFLVATMINFKDSTKSFGMLAVFSVLTTICGIVLGLGFSLTVGVTWTPTSIVIAFLVLGMGVNNAVLLHNTFERQDKTLPIEEQNALACILFFIIVGEASIFITLTSGTTLLSFLMGMNTDFPGIKYFCLSSGLVIIACYILVLTLFDGILVLDWKRSLVYLLYFLG